MTHCQPSTPAFLGAILPLLILFISVPATHGQWVTEPPEPFALDLLSLEPVTDWSALTGNPALLFESHYSDHLQMHSTYGTTNGAFRRFVDPGRHETMNLGAFGSRSVGSRQLFSGEFGFRRTNYHNWQWLSTRMYESAHPFLKADSTSGLSRFNEIYIEGRYALHLPRNFTAGILVEYSVDEGLKNVAPKPVSEHREARAVAGLSHHIGPLQWGVYAGLTDYEEELRYREYEGSLLDEVRLISFRGYDRPIVQTLDRETRITRSSGTLYGAHARFKPFDRLVWYATARVSNRALELEEDLTRPRLEGYTSTTSKRLQSSLLWSAGRLYLGGGAAIQHKEHWAEYQPFNALVSSGSKQEFSVRATAGYRLANNLTAMAELYSRHTSTSEDDFYSSLSWSAEGEGLGFFAGFRRTLQGGAAYRLQYGYYRHRMSDTHLGAYSRSVYFDPGRYGDLALYLSGFNEQHLRFDLRVPLAGNHTLFINTRWVQRLHESDERTRSFLTTQVAYRMPIASATSASNP